MKQYYILALHYHLVMTHTVGEEEAGIKHNLYEGTKGDNTETTIMRYKVHQGSKSSISTWQAKQSHCSCF